MSLSPPQSTEPHRRGSNRALCPTCTIGLCKFFCTGPGLSPCGRRRWIQSHQTPKQTGTPTPATAKSGLFCQLNRCGAGRNPRKAALWVSKPPPRTPPQNQQRFWKTRSSPRVRPAPPVGSKPPQPRNHVAPYVAERVRSMPGRVDVARRGRPVALGRGGVGDDGRLPGMTGTHSDRWKAVGGEHRGVNITPPNLTLHTSTKNIFGGVLPIYSPAAPRWGNKAAPQHGFGPAP